jgi:hypothetical protein
VRCFRMPHRLWRDRPYFGRRFAWIPQFAGLASNLQSCRWRIPRPKPNLASPDHLFFISE